MNKELILAYINDFLYVKGLKKPKKIDIVEREKSNNLTADKFRLKLLGDLEATSELENVSDAIFAANKLGIQISDLSKQAGALKPNELVATPVVDEQGRFIGVRVQA